MKKYILISMFAISSLLSTQPALAQSVTWQCSTQYYCGYNYWGNWVCWYRQYCCTQWWNDYTGQYAWRCEWH